MFGFGVQSSSGLRVVFIASFVPTTLNDPKIRRALLPWLKEENKNLWIRQEMGLNGCVADVVTVSAREVHVYEIKSDVDTLGRLADRVKVRRGGRRSVRKGQVAAYSAMADRVTLVVGTVLLEEAIKSIPPWWGILVALDEVTEVVFVPYRPALPNPDLRWINVFRFLWRDEALGFCERLGVARGVRGASKAKLKKRLKEAGVSLEALRSEVRRVLVARVWS